MSVKDGGKSFMDHPAILIPILPCSNGTPVRNNLIGWSALQIGMCYHLPSHPSLFELIALLKHRYRVCFVKMMNLGNLQ